MGGRIRGMTGIGDARSSDAPKMLLLDIPDNGGYYVSDATEVTTDTISAFIECFKAKALERLQLA